MVEDEDEAPADGHEDWTIDPEAADDIAAAEAWETAEEPLPPPQNHPKATGERSHGDE